MNRWKVLATLIGLGALLAAARVLPLADWTIQLVEVIRSSGAWGVALFIATYAVSTVALVPGSILTMMAGFVDGPVYGLIVVVPAALLGATSAFLLGRTVLRDWVRRKMDASPRTRALDKAIDRAAFESPPS